MKNIKPFVAVFAASAVFLYLPDFATSQITNPSADTLKAYELGEIIVTANRFEEVPFTVGRNVTVITRREIQQSVHYSLGELLAGQQSVHLVGSGQTPGAIQSVFIRNTNSDNSVVMIDGVRISDPSSTENSLNLAELSLANVQRIEIVRGSHSTLYGSSAVGGVINIITKDNPQDGFSGGLETKHGVYSRDTYSTSNNAFAGYAWESGVYLNAAAQWQNTRGIDATVDTISSQDIFATSDRDGFEKLDLAGKIGFKNDRWNTYLSYRRAGQSHELDQSAFEDDDNAESDFRRDLLHYRTDYKFSDRFKLSFSGGYSDLSRDVINDSSVVDRAGNYDGSVNETHAVGTLLENELNGQYQTDHVTATAGMGSSRQTMNIKTYTFERSFNFESSTDLDSLDLEETINYAFLHTEWNGGLLDESLDPFSLGLGGRLIDHNQFGTNTVFEINPKVQVTSRTLIYGAVTTGFNAPSLYQLHTPEQSAGTFTNRGNEDLEPETSVSYELGWKQRIGGRLRFNIALFKTEVENVIEYIYLWNGDTAVDELSFQDYRGDTYLNVSRQDIRGLEIGFDAQITPRLLLHGDASFTGSELSFSPEDIDRDQTGDNHVQIFESGAFVSQKKELDGLTRRPDFSGSFRVRYRPIDKLFLTLSSRFVGARDDIAYSAALGPYGALEYNKVDAYNLTDFGVRYEVSENFALHFKAENIFDEEYAEINGYRTKGRGFFLKGSFSF